MEADRQQQKDDTKLEHGPGQALLQVALFLDIPACTSLPGEHGKLRKRTRMAFYEASREEYCELKKMIPDKLTVETRQTKQSWNAFLDRLFSLQHSSSTYRPVFPRPANMANSEVHHQKLSTKASRKECLDTKMSVRDNLLDKNRQMKSYRTTMVRPASRCAALFLDSTIYVATPAIEVYSGTRQHGRGSS